MQKLKGRDCMLMWHTKCWPSLKVMNADSQLCLPSRNLKWERYKFLIAHYRGLTLVSDRVSNWSPGVVGIVATGQELALAGTYSSQTGVERSSLALLYPLRLSWMSISWGRVLQHRSKWHANKKSWSQLCQTDWNSLWLHWLKPSMKSKLEESPFQSSQRGYIFLKATGKIYLEWPETAV